MKIAVHGTQGGANTFTTEFLSGVSDPNSDAPSDHSAGHQCFAISFTKNECVFSKYGIIKDVQGNKRVGYIGFSLGISNENKMIGSDVKKILDRISEEFYSKHIDEYNNWDSFHENWSFIEVIKRDYHDKEKTISDNNNIEVFKQGEKDAAFIYYSSEEELANYLDVPYIEEYKAYKRVFFINKKYRGEKNNPLNALRHSEDADLTNLKILENLPYRVVFSNNSRAISIKVNVQGRQIQNNDKVHPNDFVEILFSKRNYKDEPIGGTIEELKYKFSEFVNVDNSNRKLTIITPKNLTAVEKAISFSILNYKGKEIKDADIVIKSIDHKTTKRPENNSITFKADELDEKWEVIINGENEEAFIPNEKGSSIQLKIKIQKTVSFKIIPTNYKLSVKNLNRDVTIDNGGKKIIFINQAIEDDCIVIISSNGYEDKEINFYPKQTDSIDEVLERKKELNYYIDVAEGSIEGSKSKTFYEGEAINYKEIESRITAPKGKKIRDTRLDNFNGKIIVEYEDKPKFYKDWRVLAGSVVILGVLFFSVFYTMFGTPDSNIETAEKTQYIEILEFAEGTDLRLDSINIYIETVKNEIKLDNIATGKEHEEDGWLKSFLNLFKSKSPEINKNEDWVSLVVRLKTADSIRKAVNNGEIVMLNTFNYSENQMIFKNTIHSIDTSHAKSISDAMKGNKDKISMMKIDTIAIFLNNYQAILRIEEEVRNKKGSQESKKDFLIEKRDSIVNNLKLNPEEYLVTANKVKDSILKDIDKQLGEDQVMEREADAQKPLVQMDGIKAGSKGIEMTEIDKSPKTQKIDQQKNGDVVNFEKEFWNLIRNKNDRFGKYQKLEEDYSNISSDNPIKILLVKYFYKEESFNKSKKVFKEASDLEELKKIVDSKDINGLKKLISKP